VEEACTEYLAGNHASDKVSRKLGYADNGQHLAHRDDTGHTMEFQLRLDRQTWQKNRDDISCSVIGIEPSLAMFGARSGDHG